LKATGAEAELAVTAKVSIWQMRQTGVLGEVGVCVHSHSDWVVFS